MSSQRIVEDSSRRSDGDDARRRVLAGAPVTERRLDLAGVSTAVLEAGQGPPVVLLHGQGGWSGMWLPVIADLMKTHRVIAADLPGLGASVVPDGPADAARVLAWLDALIQRTCQAPPALVGASLGASIAARFAIAHPDRLSRLVLAAAGSLGRFRPAPGVVLALLRFIARPSERTQQGFLRQVAVDPARVRALMGERWEASQAYSLERARTPSVRAANRRLLRELGTKTIPARGPGADRRPDRAHLGAPRPGDAAADRPGGQRPLRLAAAGDRGRRPLRGRAAGSVPGGTAGGARRPLMNPEHPVRADGTDKSPQAFPRGWVRWRRPGRPRPASAPTTQQERNAVLGAGKYGQETAGALFDECRFPVLVKDFELAGWDATGDTARASIHGVGRADRSNPGYPVNPTGTVDHGRDPL
jgi:pimeloyl-ACP methyl ester carboxylesterase